MLAAEVFLADLKPAGDVIDDLDEGVILHAGPPIAWDRMCGPMRGAVAGAIVLEGWAPDLETAVKMAGVKNNSLKVINVGLERFGDDLKKQDVAVVQVDWSPPAGGDPDLAALLSKLGS